jgi:hypothetical protein
VFGDSIQGLQHLRRARLTAVSVGLPLVRCTNSGISCLIDPLGRIRDTIADENGRVFMAKGTAIFSAPRGGVATSYRHWGDMLPFALLGLLLVGSLGWKFLRTRVRRPRRLRVDPLRRCGSSRTGHGHPVDHRRLSTRSPGIHPTIPSPAAMVILLLGLSASPVMILTVRPRSLERTAGSRSDPARQQYRLSQDCRYIILQSALGPGGRIEQTSSHRICVFFPMDLPPS